MVLAPFFGVMVAGGAGRPCAAEPARLQPRQAHARFLQDSRLWPGFKRLFGLEGWMNLVKGLVKIAIVGMAIWTQLWPERGMLESILTQSPQAVVGDMTHLLFKVLIAALVGAAGDRGAGLFLAAHALHEAQPHVQAGDQGRISARMKAIPPSRPRSARSARSAPGSA